MNSPLSAVLVDDESLALKRLQRMLEATGRVRVAAAFSDPEEALAFLSGPAAGAFDILFLDIEMPGLNGFQLLERLEAQPLVVFTTAYSQYALQAFEVHSVDYLLKPVSEQALDRALTKFERLARSASGPSASPAPQPDLRALAVQVAQALAAGGGSSSNPAAIPSRLPSRTGDKVEFVDLARVTHFYASDKLTFAATPQKDYAIDFTIGQLEERLDPNRWIRVHRSTIVNIESILELHTWFGGKVLLRLNDGKRTEITVARDRAKDLKDRIGLP